MKRSKMFLIGLLLVPASWTRRAEVHDAALAGDHFIVTPDQIRGAFAAKASCAQNAADGGGN